MAEGVCFCMIRITDLTLSCLDEYDAPPEKLQRLCELLQSVGADATELSTQAYKKIKKLPEKGKYILRVDSRDEINSFPEFDRYVCRRNRFTVLPEAILEIQLNDIREIYSLRQYSTVPNIRIVGLDDVLSHDYQTVFTNIKNALSGRVEFCPEDKYFCAGASATEWILQGGQYIAASFAGVGGKAALEEVVMALRLEVRHKPNTTFEQFPEIKKLLEEITGHKFPKNKAVIGENIFFVEAGIHADGISKDPKIYEPFTPELVGNERKLIIGKHSGKAAIAMKLRELNINNPNADLKLLLQEAQKLSIEKQSSLTDEEFERLYYRILSTPE